MDREPVGGDRRGEERRRTQEGHGCGARQGPREPRHRCRRPTDRSQRHEGRPGQAQGARNGASMNTPTLDEAYAEGRQDQREEDTHIQGKVALYQLASDYRAAALKLADLDLDAQTISDTLESL